MKLTRSKSCILKDKAGTIQAVRNDQKNRKLSLNLIRKRVGQQKQKQKLTQSMDLMKRNILAYIEKRSDVEIINHQIEYKQQFFRKSVSLQSLLYEKPQIRQKYLSQENEHFFRGFQQTLLNLFRKKVIVAGSYTNLRQQAVKQIQKWVLSWIQRQILYKKAKQQQQIEANQNQNLLYQIQQYAKEIQIQKPLF